MKNNRKQWPFLINSYEHTSEPLATRSVFLHRLYRNALMACIILGLCLVIGIIGYKYGGPMGWVDAIHNASMILSGMGPVVEIKTTWGKLFSSAYALFSGVAFITNIGVLIAPIAHRFFHKLHAEEVKD